MHTCPNCQYEFETAFCGNCGQKFPKRISMHSVIHDIPHSVFHLDKGIFRNLKGIIHPAKAAQEYLSGIRKTYFNPFFFYLITYSLISYIEYKLGININYMMELEAADGKMYDVGTILSDYLKYLFFFNIFLFAVPLTLFFKKEKGYNYAESCISATFIWSYVNIFYLLLIFFPFSGNFPANPIVLFALLLFTFLTYYKKPVLLSLFKAVIVIAIQIALFLIFNILLGYFILLFM